jgi:hypothetical protein
VRTGLPVFAIAVALGLMVTVRNHDPAHGMISLA